MEIRLLLVPYDSGQRDARMGAGPQHLCALGLEKYLAANGHSIEREVIEPASQGWRTEIQTSFALMRAVAESVRRARETNRFPIVLSGNCHSTIGVIGGLGAGTGVVWFDAHGDFNTPETTTGGFFDGMALAIATGRCWRGMAAGVMGFERVPEKNVALIGVREVDPDEEIALAGSEIRRISAAAASRDVASHLQLVAEGATQFCLHLDLDVIDSTEGRANGFAVPGGLSRKDLQTVLGTIARTLPIQALTISSYDPACDKDGAIGQAAFEAASTVLREAAGLMAWSKAV